MKLYEVPRNTRIVVSGEELNFHHIDGMYSYCTDDDNNVIHLSALTEVTIKNAKNENMDTRKD